jgi:N-methylhydantoinase A
MVIGVDSGGTFTDLVAFGADGEVEISKLPSTPDDPARAVAAGIHKITDADRIRRVIHGTTVSTNAVIERHGAQTCLLTTAGFEDVAYIQRINRKHAFRFDWVKPAPLVKRRHIIGVDERIDAEGVVITPLDDEECARIATVVKRMISTGECEAVAICLLFSYLNNTHERALVAALADELPDTPVSTSVDVSPTWREYERTSTTLADAYVRPLMSRYLTTLDRKLGGDQRTWPLLMLKSNGGTGSPASIVPRPVSMLLSGLAGGVVGGAYFGRVAGERRCITLDMGGTSTDIGLVDDGHVKHIRDYELEWGLPIAMPVVDVHTIGSGGGSIARVDDGGLVRVGPESAAAMPGPACYGQGGTDPTVTDANLALGRLNPDYFLGGAVPLHAAAATRVLDDLRQQLDLDSVESAALAVVEIASENMANAIRLLTIERGIDPRDHTLVAFGGAGPLHACRVSEALGIGRVLIPPHPGVCSAFGAAIAPPRVDRSWSIGRRSDELDEAALRRQFHEATTSACQELDRDGVSDVRESTLSVACRYYSQNYEQRVSVEDLDDGFLGRASTAFHHTHERQFGFSFPTEVVEFVEATVTVAAEHEQPSPDLWYASDTELTSTRQLWSDDSSWTSVPVFRRGNNAPRCEGPAVFEELDSTTWVPHGWTAQPGPAGSLLLTRTSA